MPTSYMLLLAKRTRLPQSQPEVDARAFQGGQMPWLRGEHTRISRWADACKSKNPFYVLLIFFNFWPNEILFLPQATLRYPTCLYQHKSQAVNVPSPAPQVRNIEIKVKLQQEPSKAFPKTRTQDHLDGIKCFNLRARLDI